MLVNLLCCAIGQSGGSAYMDVLGFDAQIEVGHFQR
jgi:hypothetical protein